jgi:hypothetical protein
MVNQLPQYSPDLIGMNDIYEVMRDDSFKMPSPVKKSELHCYEIIGDEEDEKPKAGKNMVNF